MIDGPKAKATNKLAESSINRVSRNVEINNSSNQESNFNSLNALKQATLDRQVE